MIDVFSNPTITWALTIVLLLSATYHLYQAIKTHQTTHQINNTLHALMHTLMAAMLWHLGTSTTLPQIIILTAAAFWFTLQAIARPEIKILCTTTHNRLKCAYHSLTMTAAALMIAMMAGVTTTGYSTAPTNGNSHTHHTMTTPVKNTAATTFEQSPNLAILLTVFFAAATTVFIILLLRFRATKNAHHNSATPSHDSRKEHGLEALGAATMTLMFATMTT